MTYNDCDSIVTKRQELEADLAKAEVHREYLEAALAEAKAALLNTVTDASKIDANRAEVNAKVDKARARCRQLRAALVELDHAGESITRSREQMDTLIRQSEELAKQELTASPPSLPSREHAVRGENEGSQDESGKRKPVHRSKIGLSEKEPGPKDALARSTLIRQTIELFCLVFAYLLYFHIDVQLQIVTLPSAFG